MYMLFDLDMHQTDASMMLPCMDVSMRRTIKSEQNSIIDLFQSFETEKIVLIN